MMSKQTKWFLALGVVSVISANGLVMAATAADAPEAPEKPRGHGFRQHGERPENKELLALLKIDAQTFRAETGAGKTLLDIAKEHDVSEKKLRQLIKKQMTQRVEAAEKAGKLTTEQAKKMKADLDKHVTAVINGEAPMHRGPGGRHQGMADPALLSLLNIDKETLQSELKAGKTLAAIAAERGVPEQALKAALIEQHGKRLNEAVTAGKLTAEQAEKMKGGMEERVSKMINGEAPMHRGPGGRHQGMADPALLSLLNIDKETLQSELKAGKTLAAIAAERGVSEQALKAALIEQHSKRLDEAVTAGKLTAEQAEKMKAGMEERVGKMINGKHIPPRD